ncbi:hypothetical protein KP509_07G069800 [Ceratopteris richardii]|uniref:Uncharacterized protein n=1 Tax=Ceratopteris richardii TaxID=49495 RepID=A0A8T2UHT7_CERRI|nr:hypothetical protein KP509_07G069800 [Ceratopteris richardii]
MEGKPCPHKRSIAVGTKGTLLSLITKEVELWHASTMHCNSSSSLSVGHIRKMRPNAASQFHGVAKGPTPCTHLRNTVARPSNSSVTITSFSCNDLKFLPRTPTSHRHKSSSPSYARLNKEGARTDASWPSSGCENDEQTEGHIGPFCRHCNQFPSQRTCRCKRNSLHLPRTNGAVPLQRSRAADIIGSFSPRISGRNPCGNHAGGGPSFYFRSFSQRLNCVDGGILPLNSPPTSQAPARKSLRQRPFVTSRSDAQSKCKCSAEVHSNCSRASSRIRDGNGARRNSGDSDIATNMPGSAGLNSREDDNF